jgi:hypothetical protein
LRVARAVGGPSVYCAIFGAIAVAHGLPLSNVAVFFWIVLGLLAFSLSDLRGWFLGALFEWAPFILILFVYDLLRSVADGTLVPPQVGEQIHADQALFGGHVPTVWLQAHFWHGANHLHWWDYTAWCVYMSYFFVTPVVAGVVWIRARWLFRRFVVLVCALSFAGFITYVAFPAAPPWWAYSHHHLGISLRLVKAINAHIHVLHFDAVFARGGHYANDVAALPSLHAAEALLVSLFLWRLVPRFARPLLVLYPVAMGLALVYTGEHYVTDILIGWAYASATFALANAWFNRSAVPSNEPNAPTAA